MDMQEMDSCAKAGHVEDRTGREMRSRLRASVERLCGLSGGGGLVWWSCGCGSAMLGTVPLFRRFPSSPAAVSRGSGPTHRCRHRSRLR